MPERTCIHRPVRTEDIPRHHRKRDPLGSVVESSYPGRMARVQLVCHEVVRGSRLRLLPETAQDRTGRGVQSTVACQTSPCQVHLKGTEIHAKWASAGPKIGPVIAVIEPNRFESNSTVGSAGVVDFYGVQTDTGGYLQSPIATKPAQVNG